MPDIARERFFERVLPKISPNSISEHFSGLIKWLWTKAGKAGESGLNEIERSRLRRLSHTYRPNCSTPDVGLVVLPTNLRAVSCLLTNDIVRRSDAITPVKMHKTSSEPAILIDGR